MQFNATIAAEDVNDFFISLNNMIPIANRSAMESSVSQVNQAMIMALAADNGMPITVVSHRVMTDTTTPVGKVWIGTMPVNSEWLQPFEETGAGAYAGQFFFPDAFVVDKNGRNREYIARRAFRGEMDNRKSMKRYYKKHGEFKKVQSTFVSRYPIVQMVTEDLKLKNTMGSPIEMAGNTYMQVFIDKLDEVK